MQRRLGLLALAATSLLPAAASASETITYGYDAKGRLVTVARGGNVSPGVTTTYGFDAADNRTSESVTGSQFAGPAQRVVVVPIGGFKIIPLP